jgi:predicted nucleic acid-binding protein
VARRNLTVQLVEETIRQAKILAAKRGTSISGLVAQELELLVAGRAGAARLVTEDLQPGRRIGGVTIENPFA